MFLGLFLASAAFKEALKSSIKLSEGLCPQRKQGCPGTQSYSSDIVEIHSCMKKRTSLSTSLRLPLAPSGKNDTGDIRKAK